MGARKRHSAEIRKEQRKNLYIAKLNNCPISPRKTRLVADLIRGKNVEEALNILKFCKKASSVYLEKLLLSAIANWQKKNEGVRIEESDLFIEKIFVDGGRQLKRIRPAPHGRAYRIRKRSNHVTIILNSKKEKTEKQLTPVSSTGISQETQKNKIEETETKQNN